MEIIVKKSRTCIWELHCLRRLCTNKAHYKGSIFFCKLMPENNLKNGQNTEVRYRDYLCKHQ